MPTCRNLSKQAKQYRGAYIVVAHGVHIVLQVTFSIIRQNYATKFAIASKVEASIRGEHQETSHIPPTNLILRNEKETLKLQVKIVQLTATHPLDKS